MSKRQYLEMFDSICLNNKEIIPEVEENIAWAKNTLVKKDKIDWFLRHYKASQLARINVNHPERIGPKERRWLEKNSACGNEFYRLRSIKSDLEHFVRDMGLDSIDKYQFGKRTFDAIHADLSRLEDEADCPPDRSVREYGEVVMRMPDGLTWFDLKTPGCFIEKNAMHHCGNVNGHENQNLYSLRSIDPERKGHWIPHVTLVMNDKDNGISGEIKGFGNSRPAEKYFDAIVAFLKLPLVKEMQGGGYLPGNNFVINNLSDEQKSDLFAARPEVFRLIDRYRINERQITQDMLQGIRKEFYVTAFNGEDAASEPLVIMQGNGVDSLARLFKLDELIAFSDTLINGHFNKGCYDSLNERKDEARQLLDHIERNRPDILLAIKQHLQDTVNHLDKGDGVLNDTHGLLEMITLQDGVIAAALKHAIFNGDESRAFKALENAYRDTLSGIGQTLGHGFKVVQAHPDEDWHLEISVKDALDFLMDNQSNLANMEIYPEQSNLLDCLSVYAQHLDTSKLNDFDVPYDGFSGYDEASACSSVIDVMQDALDEIEAAQKIKMKKSHQKATENGLPRCVEPFTDVIKPIASESFQRKHQSSRPEL